MVISLAELVLQAVPAAQQHDSTVNKYRELLAARAQRKAIT